MDQKDLHNMINEIIEKFGAKNKKLYGEDLKLFKLISELQDQIQNVRSYVDGLYLRNEQYIPREIFNKEIEKIILKSMKINK